MLNITPYKKAKDSMILTNRINNDSYHSFLLSQLVLNRKTNHILLPIVNVDARFNQISDVLNKFDSFDYYMNELQNGKISDLFSIRVKENFFKSEIIDKYLSNENIKFETFIISVNTYISCNSKRASNFRT